ncbi:unnamed protein product [Sympodiomycopsis kandeliae]
MPENTRPKHSEHGFAGLLSAQDIDTLLQEHGNDLVSPALWRAHAGASPDGILHVPGSLKGYQEVKRRLVSAQDALANNPTFSWWPAAVAEDGINTILVRDILTGLILTRWTAYKTKYKHWVQR